MPFESKAQQGFLEAHPEKIGGRAKLKEWENATNFKSLPEKKGMDKKKIKHAKHGMTHTHIEHHADGSHSVRHEMHNGETQSSAHANDADMMEHMQGQLDSQAPAAAPPAAAGAASGPMAP
jgi:hypothetical protein